MALKVPLAFFWFRKYVLLESFALCPHHPSSPAHCFPASHPLHSAKTWTLRFPPFSPDPQPGLLVSAVCWLVSKLCLTLCGPLDFSPPVSSVHGISQTRILEWITISFSRGSSWPRDQTCGHSIVGRFFTPEPPGETTSVEILAPSFIWCLSLSQVLNLLVPQSPYCKIGFIKCWPLLELLS